jgi:hypothetical protein
MKSTKEPDRTNQERERANREGEVRRRQEKARRSRNAEKQKRFRESMKARGYRQVLTWEKRPGPEDQGFTRVTVRIHASSFGITDRDPAMEQALSPVINQLVRQYREGRLPRDLYEDTAALLTPLGEHYLLPVGLLSNPPV